MQRSSLGSFSIDSLMAPTLTPTRLGSMFCNGYVFLPPPQNSVIPSSHSDFYPSGPGSIPGFTHNQLLGLGSNVPIGFQNRSGLPHMFPGGIPFAFAGVNQRNSQFISQRNSSPSSPKTRRLDQENYDKITNEEEAHQLTGNSIKL